MPSLREIQQEVMRVLALDGNAEIPAFIRPGALAARGLAAYRNTARANLHNALRGVYPVVERLVGTGFFTLAAEKHIDSTPSTRGDLNRYGAEFPAFLRSFQPAASLPYLADVAALEWACHEVHGAPEANPGSFDHLRTVAPEDYERLVPRLHPAVRLLKSPYPVLDIWRKNQSAYAGDRSVSLSQGSDSLLVHRTSTGIEIERLDPAEWQLLFRSSRGTCLEQALNDLPDFDLAAVLARQTGAGVLIGLFLPPDTGQG